MLKLTWNQIIHEPGALFTIMVAFAVGFITSRKGNPAVQIGLLGLAVMHLLYPEATRLGKCWMWAVIFGFVTYSFGLHYALLALVNGIKERLRSTAMGSGHSRTERETPTTNEYNQGATEGGSSSERNTAYQQSQAEFSSRKQERDRETGKRAKEKAAQARRERANRAKAEQETDDFFKQAKEAAKKAKEKAEQKPPPKPSPQPKFREWWEVLGVSPTATLTEIKKARNAKAMQFHSDKIQHMSEAFKQEAEEELKAINTAFEKAKKYANK